jgi:exosortase F-associated protein
MQRNKTIVLVRFLAVILIIAVFGIIRIYENELFYDPFLIYFKSNYSNSELPKVDFLHFSLGLLFRYFLNTILSIAVLYLIFLDLEILKFSTLIYGVFFIFLLGGLYFVLEMDQNPNKMTLFYVRRFLIQPLLLLIFIPAFFFQKQKN